MSCIVCLEEDSICNHTDSEYLATLIYAQDQTTRATRAIAKLLLIPMTASLLGSLLIVLGMFIFESPEVSVAGWLVIGIGSIWGVIEAWVELNQSVAN